MYACGDQRHAHLHGDSSQFSRTAKANILIEQRTNRRSGKEMMDTNTYKHNLHIKFWFPSRFAPCPAEYVSVPRGVGQLRKLQFHPCSGYDCLSCQGLPSTSRANTRQHTPPRRRSNPSPSVGGHLQWIYAYSSNNNAPR